MEGAKGSAHSLNAIGSVCADKTVCCCEFPAIPRIDQRPDVDAALRQHTLNGA